MADLVRVLVVDDDPAVRELLDDYLSDQGFEVVLADGAPTGRAAMSTGDIGAVLLDVGLPGEDGLSLARHIREYHDIGIIMVSGAGETVDRIIGLEVGADDYVAKPFDLRELKARLKSVLRRYQRSNEAQPTTTERPSMPEGSPPIATRRVAVGASVLDLDSHQLFGPSGDEIPLTRLEFELLSVLVARPNRPLSRDQLMNLTQGRDWDPMDRSIDIRVARLRSKIESDPERPQLIRTMRGIGYMYMPQSPQRPDASAAMDSAADIGH